MPADQGLESLLIALLDATDKFAIVRVAGGVRPDDFPLKQEVLAIIRGHFARLGL
jgi:hypothetical protein